MKINIGDFAICQKGELGLVLWECPCKDKRTNKPYTLYHGINLNPDKFGLNWQSRSPTKVNKNYVKKMFKTVERRKSPLESRTVSKPGAVLNVKAVPIPPKIQSKMAEAIRGEK